MKIIRELTKSEIFFCQQHDFLNAYLTPFIRVKVQGEIIKDDLEKALKQVMAKYPLLAACIKKQKNKYLFCETDDPVIEIKFINRVHEDQWMLVAYKAIKKKFDTENGPLIKLFVLKNPTGDVHDIIFVLHHAIDDQEAFFCFFNDFLAAYDGSPIDYQQPEGQAKIVTRTKKIKEKHAFSVSNYEQRYPGIKSNNFFQTCKLMLQDTTSNFFNKKIFNETKHSTHTLLLDEQQTKNILLACQRNRVNLFGLIAAVFLICAGKYSNRPFYSLIPLNFAKNRMGLGCQVGIFTKLKYFPQIKTDVWQLADYYYKFMKSLFRKIDPESFFSNIPVNNLYQQIYFALKKIKIRCVEWLQKDAIGGSMINVAYKAYQIKSKRLLFVCGSGSGNSFYFRRKKFYVGAIILNDQLNLTLSVKLKNSDAEELKNNMLRLFQEVIVVSET